MLTEETGFSGGMMWTGNNIDTTHLKTIVNFDYDETTGFLKTRASLVSTPLISVDGGVVRLEADKGLDFIGVYNTGALQFSEGALWDVNPVNGDKKYKGKTKFLKGNLPTGQLYLFGQLKFDTKTNTQSCDSLQGVFKTATDLWYKVDCDDITDVVLSQANKLKPILLNDVLYFLNNSTTQIFTAYRLECILSKNLDESQMLFKLVKQPQRIEDDTNYVSGDLWTGYRDLIDNVTMLEVTAKGYNGACGKNMYTFKSYAKYDNTQNRILGVYLEEQDTNGVAKTVPSPRIGQNVRICVVINGVLDCIDNNYKLHVYKLKAQGKQENSTDWVSLPEVLSIGQTGANFNYTFTDTTTTFAFNILPENASADVYATEAIGSLMPVTYVANKSELNQKTKPYDLNTTQSCQLWNKRMLLWGCADYDNALFLSEINNFYYFPIPYNVALFDTTIISCIPYLDSLLVFTADKLYKLTEDSDGNFIQEVIQNDISLNRVDASYIKAIKNMVLFKSGKYFYMVVPKSQSLTGELTIAPIYKNIAGLLNNMSKGLCEILTLLYPERTGHDIANSLTVSNNPEYIYTAQDTLHILYKVTLEAYTYMLFLNYNTNLRAWTMYIVDTTEQTLAPTFLTASREMSFVRLDCNTTSPTMYEAFAVQDAEVSNAFRCLIDTGYRTLSNALKKRFREVQIKLYCESENTTAFGSSFLVDGVYRRNYTKLKETYIDEQTVTLAPDYDLNTFIIEPTMPIDALGFPALQSNNTQQTQPPQGSDAIDLDDWKLDFSHFKREAPTTVRIPVSGKGFAPRFILMLPKSLSLNINEINWVYRTMYGR